MDAWGFSFGGCAEGVGGGGGGGSRAQRVVAYMEVKGGTCCAEFECKLTFDQGCSLAAAADTGVSNCQEHNM